MELTDIRIKLCNPSGGARLRAYCSLTIDGVFVIRDVKIIDGNDGPFLAMPSRRLSDHCRRCNEKNHLRARFCNNCGARLDDQRDHRLADGNTLHPGNGVRLKLHADIAHPISPQCRQWFERSVIDAYYREFERSKLPGYVPANLDGEDGDFYDAAPVETAPAQMAHARLA